jgi:hypothetical protein
MTAGAMVFFNTAVSMVLKMSELPESMYFQTILRQTPRDLFL